MNDEALRADIAAATRLLVQEGILDYSGHVSARVAGEDSLIIQSRGNARNEVRPQDLLKVGFDGSVIEGREKPPSELPIHVEIYRARPDVQAVLHCHLDIAIAFTLMEGEVLKPMRARAVRWSSGIPVHPDPSHIKDLAQGQALAATLGPHHAVLMRAHGLTLTAESVRALFIDAVHFKENADAQMMVLQAGRNPVPLSAEEMRLIAGRETREWHVRKLWNYYVRRALAEGKLAAEWAPLEARTPQFEEA